MKFTLTDRERIPAVIVGSAGLGTLGLLRSLRAADIPVVLIDNNVSTPAMHSRHGHKIAVRQLGGVTLIKELQSVASALAGPAVLFLNSDDAVLTVSEHRTELENHYRFLLPGHDCVTSLMYKASFQRMAEQHGFPVPRSVIIGQIEDLSRLARLKFPCLIKPSRGTAEYMAASLARGYKVSSREEAEAVCRRLLILVPGLDLIVQEWIEGPASAIYFCLQYRTADGATVGSFTGRKLTIWPLDVGVTARCTVAPDARPILQPLTEAFFESVSFVGMGGMEFKKDVRTGQFLMIEPTVGRIDGQEEVATLHGVNIPLAAYCHQAGFPEIDCVSAPNPVIWRDFVSDWRASRSNGTHSELITNARIYDAYWRPDDPIPALFHFRDELEELLRRAVRRLHKLARSLDTTIRRLLKGCNTCSGIL